MADIQLIYDKERVRLKDLRALQSNDIAAWIETLARFVGDGNGGYMAHDDAVIEVEELNLADVETAVKSFLSTAQDETSPK